jgi:magnesium transporter
MSGRSSKTPPPHCAVDDEPPRSVRSEMPHEKFAAPPDALHLDETSGERPRIVLVDYGPGHVDEHVLDKVEECIPYLDQDSVTWLDIRGISHKQTFVKLGEIFKIHPLALADMVNVPQRPKTESYPDQHLIITRMVSLVGHQLQTEQFAILFGKGFVVTVQEEPDVDCLDPLRERIRISSGHIRSAGSDYLAYALFDAVIDGFYPVLEMYGEALEELELRLLSKQGAASTDIFAIKRELLQLRRAIWPQREVLTQIMRDESKHIHDATRPYFRDTYDHAVQIMDMVETFRELSSSLMDLHMSTISNRLNEVMKVLTIVSTIFLPMTFVAGVYGMNFNSEKSPWNMPELNWFYGYPFSLVLMVVSVVVLLLFYRSKGWIGRRGDTLGSVLTGFRQVRRVFVPGRAHKRRKPENAEP